jgi:hypothetical protein
MAMRRFREIPELVTDLRGVIAWKRREPNIMDLNDACAFAEVGCFGDFKKLSKRNFPCPKCRWVVPTIMKDNINRSDSTPQEKEALLSVLDTTRKIYEEDKEICLTRLPDVIGEEMVDKIIEAAVKRNQADAKSEFESRNVYCGRPSKANMLCTWCSLAMLKDKDLSKWHKGNFDQEGVWKGALSPQ